MSTPPDPQKLMEKIAPGLLGRLIALQETNPGFTYPLELIDLAATQAEHPEWIPATIGDYGVRAKVSSGGVLNLEMSVFRSYIAMVEGPNFAQFSVNDLDGVTGQITKLLGLSPPRPPEGEPNIRARILAY